MKVVASNRRLFAVQHMMQDLPQARCPSQGRGHRRGDGRRKAERAHLAAIKDSLKAVTKKDVQVNVKVDPAIIGGLVVKLGSRMVDTSLRTKLNAIKHAMKEVS